MKQIYKYPKTYHLEGSGLQSQGKAKVPFKTIAQRHIVVEEKMDGINVAVSFNQTGEMLLQSRGHFLTGGEREKHFSLFKQWAYSLADRLYLLLGDRYILYGEWLYAKHTVFYNFLPHYFLEYDILDTKTKTFLDTLSRQKLLPDLDIFSVPVLYSGQPNKYSELTSLIGQSNYIKSGHIQQLKALCQANNTNIEKAMQQTDNTNLMEGLYIKVEEDGVVKERYKYIRSEFITTILNSRSHWLNRVIIPNQLCSSNQTK